MKKNSSLNLIRDNILVLAKENVNETINNYL